jgi:hypothetical protein
MADVSGRWSTEEHDRFLLGRAATFALLLIFVVAFELKAVLTVVFLNHQEWICTARNGRKLQSL